MNILLCRKVFPYAPATAHSSPTSKMGAFWAVHCKGGYKFSPDDTQNYTAMLAEFRKQLGNNRLLSIAAPAGQDKYSKIQLNKISQYLNWINLMTFDYHGGWETQTDVQAPLYCDPKDPSTIKIYCVNYSVTGYFNAGVPRSMILLGLSF